MNAFIMVLVRAINVAVVFLQSSCIISEMDKSTFGPVVKIRFFPLLLVLLFVWRKMIRQVSVSRHFRLYVRKILAQENS